MKTLSGRATDSFGVQPLCKLLGITPQNYYKTDWNRDGMDEIRKKSFIEYVRNIRKLDPGLGGKKAVFMYNKQVDKKEQVGRDRGLLWLTEEGLCKVAKKIKKPRTTDSDHDLKVYPNLTDSLIASRFGEVISADITYVRLKKAKAFCYLTLIMDSYSREVLGWAVGDTLETKHSLRALDMAIGVLEEKEVDLKKTIHHSDCGVQFASDEYTGPLKRKGVRISMAKGSPLKNAKAERVNGIFKNELLKGKRFSNAKELWKATIKAVYFYNEERPHLSLGMMTPKQVADGLAKPSLLWRSYRTRAILKEKNRILIVFRQSLEWHACGPDYLPSGATYSFGNDWTKFDGSFKTVPTPLKEEKKCRNTITPPTKLSYYEVAGH